jgi:tetratricopeptide (TPR) repeat protein
VALYDAFISYSHAKDKPIAAALQRAVQTLGKPWYQRRALRVFRDDTSLSATPQLWPTIEQALGRSRFLILLASPEAAASQWVNKEVAYWLAHKSADTLLIAVTDGTLVWDNALNDFAPDERTPLPPALKGRFAAEPKWVDLAAYRAGADKRDAKFTELAADFAAAIRGMPKEDLLSQEVKQQRRALRLAFTAAALLLVLGIGATVASFVAVAQRNRAEKTLAAASQTANDLVFNLAAQFRDRRGMPIALVRDILGRADGLQRQLAAAGETTPLLRYAESAALNELAITLQIIGDLPAALDATDRSIAVIERLAAAEPDNAGAQRDVGVVYQTKGNVLRALGRREDALAAYRKSLAIYERLAAKDPGNEEWQGHAADADALIGRTLSLGGERQQALEFYRRALAIRQKLADAQPAKAEWQRQLAAANVDIGDALDAAGKLTEALDAYRTALAIDQKLAASDPENTKWQADLTVAYETIGDVLRKQGQREEALASYRKSLEISEKLAALDPGNARQQSDLAWMYRKIGEVLQDSGRSREALDLFRKGFALDEKLAAADPSNAQWQDYLALDDIRVANALLLLGRSEEGFDTFRKGLAVREKLAASDPRNTDWQWKLGQDYRGIGVALENSRRWVEALDYYQKGLAVFVKLAALDPGNASFQRELAAAYNNVGNALRVLGRRDEASDALRKSVELAERRVAAAPDSAAAQDDLAQFYSTFGDFLAGSDPAQSLEYYKKAVAIFTKLAAADPGNARVQGSLVSGDFRIGSQLAASDVDGALTSFSAGLALLDQLVAADPGNWQWLDSRAMGDGLIASALQGANRLDEALDYAWKAVATRESISTADPANVGALVALGRSYANVAEILLALKRNEEAVSVLRKCLAIREKLVANAPDNPGWQTDVVWTLIGLARGGDDAIVRLTRALEILGSLKEAGKSLPGNDALIPRVQAFLSAKYAVRGREQLYRDRLDAAVGDMLSAVKVAPSDQFAVLWLHIARARAGENDTEELAANAGRLDQSKWPWPVVQLFLGRSDPEALQAAAQNAAGASERDGQVCEAYFYAGVYRIERGAAADARPLLQFAADHCPPNYSEHLSAKLELQRLDAVTSAPSR